MIDIEDELRAFGRWRADRKGPADLADRVIARATAHRRRRLAAISMTAVIAVVLLVSVTLLRVPWEQHPDPAQVGSGPVAESAGRPVQVAMFGPHSVLLPDGAEQKLTTDPEEIVTDVHRAEGAWVVQSSNSVRALPAASVVRDNDSTMPLGSNVISVVPNAAGDRVAVQSRVDGDQRVAVVDVLSGKQVASTSLPGDVDSAPVVTGWAGSLVVLSAPNGDRGAVASDVWDPARGPYHPSMSGERLILGPAAAPGQLLALAPGADPTDTCLTWVDPTNKFAQITRNCSVPLRLSEPAWLSSDGVHVVQQQNRKVIAVNVYSMVVADLGLPEQTMPIQLGWEGSSTALVLTSGGIFRCVVDGSPCEGVPVPRMDGAAPLGFVD